MDLAADDLIFLTVAEAILIRPEQGLHFAMLRRSEIPYKDLPLDGTAVIVDKDQAMSVFVETSVCQKIIVTIDIFDRAAA